MSLSVPMFLLLCVACSCGSGSTDTSFSFPMHVSAQTEIQSQFPFIADLSTTHTNVYGGGTFSDAPARFTFSQGQHVYNAFELPVPARFVYSTTFSLTRLPISDVMFMALEAVGQFLHIQLIPPAQLPARWRIRTKFARDFQGSVDRTHAVPIMIGMVYTISVQVDTSAIITTINGMSETYPYESLAWVAATVSRFAIRAGDEGFGGGAEGTITALSITAPASTEAPTPTPTSTPTLAPGTGAGIGDPQFTGFHGQSYQVHGYPDTWFNIIASPHINVNAEFVYIEAGICTYNNTACWTHPGTYMSSFGVTITAPNSNGSNSATARVSLSAGPYAVGLLDARVNGHILPVGSRIRTSSMSLIRSAADRVSVQAGEFKLTFINSDMFFNIQVQLQQRIITAAQQRLHIQQQRDTTDSNTHDVHPHIAKTYPNIAIHGLVGQSWRNVVWPAGRLYEGSVDDYVCSAQFAHDSAFNVYVEQQQQQPQNG